MYRAFYRFRKTPFSPDPDPDFLYVSDTYETALAVLANSLANSVVVSVVLGETGMGKTTLIEYLLRHSPPGSTVWLISETINSPRQMLRSMLKNFGQSCKNSKPEECYQQLVDFLCAVRKQQTQAPLLIIDDAHTLGVNALKWVSKLCAVNAGGTPLLQLVLVGRKGLSDLLKNPELSAFSNRIGAFCYLEPLTADETKKYIHHRLETAGAANNDLFDEQSCLTIYGYSKGNPKAINELCQDALVYGGNQRVGKIDSSLIRKVASKAWQPEPLPVKTLCSPVPRRIEIPWHKKVDKTAFLVGGVVLGVALAILLVPGQYFSHHDSSQTVSTNVSGNNLTGRKTIKEESIQPAKSDQAILIETTPSTATKKQPDIASRIDNPNLFDAAESHLRALRLTTPRGNNAHEIYQSILDRDPENQAARQGLERVAEKYTVLAERKARDKEFAAAIDFLDKAFAILPESATTQQSLENVIELQNKMEGVDSLAALAQEAIDKGQFEEANLQLTNAAQILPNAPKLLETRKKLLAKRKAMFAAEFKRREHGIKDDVIASTPDSSFRDRLNSGSLGPRMSVIPGGTYRMGDIHGRGDSDEMPVHQVEVANSFAIARYEVTFDEYDLFAAAKKRKKPNDHGWGRGRRPVINVSWRDAVAYTRWLSDETGQRYRLPTEAEWEYVARAGTQSEFWWGNAGSHDYANYGKDVCCDGLSAGKDTWLYTAPVGSFPPNAFGVYDTAGNVWEWTGSIYEKPYQGAELIPEIDTHPGPRVARGGAWNLNAKGLRSAYRLGSGADFGDSSRGFRVARDLE